MPAKKPEGVIKVDEAVVRYTSVNGQDYISLTDMAKQFGGERAISSWLRGRPTIEFLGAWEALNNPGFKPHEFVGFKNQSGSNRFNPSPKQWIARTGAIGLTVKAGRYGGTNAHQDIAFEFASYLSPEFKLYLIREFQRLKQNEQKLEQWDYRRFLTKVNYRLQTDAIQKILVPLSVLPEERKGILYAGEAEIVNLALFGMASNVWRKENPKLAKTGNLRDYATIEQLTVLANLESMNSMFIHDGMDKQERFDRLRAEAARQLTALLASHGGLLP
jgi:hypothetical protein